MSTNALEQRLSRIREGAKERIPDEILETMHHATQQLEASGQAERAIGEADEAPGFDLRDSAGGRVSLDGLLENGPAVVTFFRGHW